jgi:hypothetical protein
MILRPSKTHVIFTLVALLLLGMFPPWESVLELKSESQYLKSNEFLGHHFLLSQPKAPGVFAVGVVRLDVGRFCLSGFLMIVASVLLGFVPAPKCSSERWRTLAVWIGRHYGMLLSLLAFVIMQYVDCSTNSTTGYKVAHIGVRLLGIAIVAGVLALILMIPQRKEGETQFLKTFLKGVMVLTAASACLTAFQNFVVFSVDLRLRRLLGT